MRLLSRLILVLNLFPSCISASGEDEGTAADESEFGCTQVASSITESETGRGGETGLE